MPPKRAAYYTHGCDEQCAETKKFIEDHGVVIEFRDIEKNPLTSEELDKLIGHVAISHFINPAAANYQKQGLDKDGLDRDTVLSKLAEDNTLLKRPIIKTLRLVTVGVDKKRISEMLQLSANGNNNIERVPSFNTSQKGNNSRGSRSNSPTR